MASPSYVCEKCDKGFDRKDLYNRHLARKTPCAKANGYPCRECNASFSTRKKLHDHIDTTHGVNKDNSNVEETGLANSSSQPKPESEISASESALDVHLEDVAVSVELSVIEQYELSDLKPLNFGSEDQSVLDSMSYDELKKALKLTPTLDTLFAMIKLINMNPDIPQNRNILLKDVHGEDIHLFHRGRWNTVGLKETVMNLIGRNRLRFYDLEGILTKHMKKKALTNLDEYLDDIESIANGSRSQSTHEDFDNLIDDIKEELAKLSIDIFEKSHPKISSNVI